MIGKASRHCTVELQALPSRIGQVRRIVSAHLRYWHLDPLIDPAALGVTELLTNVHRHAEPDKQCRVEIDLCLDRLTVSVRDNDPRVPSLRGADPTATCGRGLALVASVSESWGVRPHAEGGKVVWFTLPAPAPVVPPAPVEPPVRMETAAVAPLPARTSLPPAPAAAPARTVAEPIAVAAAARLEPAEARSTLAG